MPSACSPLSGRTEDPRRAPDVQRLVERAPRSHAHVTSSALHEGLPRLATDGRARVTSGRTPWMSPAGPRGPGGAYPRPPARRAPRTVCPPRTSTSTTMQEVESPVASQAHSPRRTYEDVSGSRADACRRSSARRNARPRGGLRGLTRSRVGWSRAPSRRVLARSVDLNEGARGDRRRQGRGGDVSAQRGSPREVRAQLTRCDWTRRARRRERSGRRLFAVTRQGAVLRTEAEAVITLSRGSCRRRRRCSCREAPTRGVEHTGSSEPMAERGAREPLGVASMVLDTSATEAAPVATTGRS